MQLKRNRPEPPDPTGWYISWNSFSAAGDYRVIARGEWLKGDDPIVKAHPEQFVPAGTHPSEWPPLVPVSEVVE